MTITTFPHDGEPLVEIQKGPLGQDVFVGTKAFMDFLADLTSFGNATINRISIINTTVNQIQQQNSAELESLRRQVERLRILPDQSLAPILRQIDDLSRSMVAQIQAIRVIAQALSAQQAETETNVNKVEHLCLSNLVRQQG